MYSLNQRFDNRDIPEDELLTSGNVACAGCGASLSMRLALKGLGKPTVLAVPACCWTIIPGAWPMSIMDVPFFHCAFETTAATISGIKAAYRKRGMDDICVVGWAGDGGTFDIGIQALSGTAERNDDIIYVCYDNEAYMNTGIQRSGATPIGSWTTTTPVKKPKSEQKKDIDAIMIAHKIPYLATATAAYPHDMIAKLKKARSIKGTRFIHLLAACPTGWRMPENLSIKVMRLAVLSNIFPLYEVENGETYRQTVLPDEIIPIDEYMHLQGRFRHLTSEDIEDYQKMVDKRFEYLKERFEKGETSAAK
ncbi:MAG: 3-methyl-2-oxobutanoate dehydrogenase subunit beta [Deltaproteobacteria bacterium]|nr:3-methyl-2-oxobutanoate dehydrogenase subunit beta [Deltaproteobacteria bacterium]MBW2339153.1 3-methyl-2-oxobutanoate dehydrogenase subunit beta [Deltaproteobacteria bacterium]